MSSDETGLQSTPPPPPPDWGPPPSPGSSDETGLEPTTKAGRTWWIVGCIVGGLVLVVLLLSMGRRARTQPNRTERVAGTGDHLEAARQALSGSGEAAIVHSALAQINLAFNKGTNNPPPALSPDQAASLQKTCGLDKGDLDEITGNTYSLLDDAHVEYCLLLRDAARSLEVHVAGLKTEHNPRQQAQRRLDQARLAFDWVVRQVRLYPGALGTPDLILRRGYGSAEDRARIFLSLVRQIGPLTESMPEITGALLFFPDANPDAKGRPRFWGCGVDVGDGQGLYVFDPRLGLPLPGADGKGIATLGELASRPDALARLNVPGAPKYDVTMKDAAGVKVEVFCPLSALAPRMRYLQEQLLPPIVEVRLAIDVAAELARLKKAATREGKAPEVEVWQPPPPPEVLGIRWAEGKVRWPEGVRTWRYFLTRAEGGEAGPLRFRLSAFPGFTLRDDTTEVMLPWKEIFRLGLVPWYDMPPFFQNNFEFPYNSGLGRNVRSIFAEPFTTAVLSPGARDLRLRGRMREAVPLLNAERQKWTDAQQRLEIVPNEELDKQFKEWVEKAQALYARAANAVGEQKVEAEKEIDQMWKQATVIVLVLHNGISRTRTGDITYEIALCKHEEAERLQARLDLLEREGKADDDDRKETTHGWRQARNDWDLVLRDYKARQETNRGVDKLSSLYRANQAAAAQQLRARAAAKLGDWKAAAADWKGPLGEVGDLEKLANLYQANLPPQQYK